MTVWEVPVAGWSSPDAIERVVEHAAAEHGLTATLKGVLASYPDSVHWHWKRGKERGVLEVTLWASGRRLWLSVHSGRTGSWTADTAERMYRALTDLLAGNTTAD